MDTKSLILFVSVIILEVMATVLFKKGTSRLANSFRKGWLSHLDNITNALRTKEIALGIFLYIIEYVLWIAFLASVQISKAFPLSSIQIVLILLASKFILKERITQRRWLGGLLIMIGIYLVGEAV
jgi:undecaprenyl phosphate-alpha-L-ara4N flippase subunit ArnE